MLKCQKNFEKYLQEKGLLKNKLNVTRELSTKDKFNKYISFISYNLKMRNPRHLSNNIYQNYIKNDNRKIKILIISLLAFKSRQNRAIKLNIFLKWKLKAKTHKRKYKPKILHKEKNNYNGFYNCINDYYQNNKINKLSSSSNKNKDEGKKINLIKDLNSICSHNNSCLNKNSLIKRKNSTLATANNIYFLNTNNNPSTKATTNTNINKTKKSNSVLNTKNVYYEKVGRNEKLSNRVFDVNFKSQNRNNYTNSTKNMNTHMNSSISHNNNSNNSSVERSVKLSYGSYKYLKDKIENNKMRSIQKKILARKPNNKSSILNSNSNSQSNINVHINNTISSSNSIIRYYQSSIIDHFYKNDNGYLSIIDLNNDCICYQKVKSNSTNRIINMNNMKIYTEKIKNYKRNNSSIPLSITSKLSDNLNISNETSKKFIFEMNSNNHKKGSTHYYDSLSCHMQDKTQTNSSSRFSNFKYVSPPFSSNNISCNNIESIKGPIYNGGKFDGGKFFSDLIVDNQNSNINIPKQLSVEGNNENVHGLQNKGGNLGGVFNDLTCNKAENFMVIPECDKKNEVLLQSMSDDKMWEIASKYVNTDESLQKIIKGKKII